MCCTPALFLCGVARRTADCFPDLADLPSKVVQSGSDSVVFDIQGEWLVRLPRRATVQAHYAAEVALLGELAERSPSQFRGRSKTLVVERGLRCCGDGVPLA